MKRLTFLFLLAVVSLCHAPSAMAHLHPNLQRFVQRDPELVTITGPTVGISNAPKDMAFLRTIGMRFYDRSQAATPH